MFYRSQSDQYISEGTQFVIDGITYSSTWLNQSTAKEKAALGLVEVKETNTPEDRKYYWVTEKLSGAKKMYVNTPKDLDMVKTTCLEEVKSIAYSTLLPTDYIEIRNLRDAKYKPDWIVWRDEVRAYLNTITASITKALTVDEVKSIMRGIEVPRNPEAPAN